MTPLRDGMNLVAKEYVAAQDPDDPGVLILSRFVGAAIDFRRALLVNPCDAELVAKAIAQALAMPIEEGHARHQALLAVVSDYDVDRGQTAGVPDRSAGREWELARAAKLTSDSRFTVGKADKPLFESERRRRAWFARLTPVLGAGAIIMASANVVAVVQSKKARGRATDSSGLRSAETAKNHAINPAAIINAAPSR